MRKFLISTVAFLLLFCTTALLMVRAQNIGGANSSGVINFPLGALNYGGSSLPVLVPPTTAANTIAPTANGAVSLTINATTGTGNPDVFDIATSGGAKMESFDGSYNGFLANTFVSHLVNYGNTFGISGCSATSPVGGGQSGQFTSGTSGTCTVTVTVGNSYSTINSWACNATDATTAADALLQSCKGTSATTFVISGTTVSGDIIQFYSQGY